MNICCLNVSSKVCLKLAPACITHRALQRLKNCTLGFIGYCRHSPRCSPLIAAERKYHLATAQTYNDENNVGRD